MPPTSTSTVAETGADRRAEPRWQKPLTVLTRKEEAALLSRTVEALGDDITILEAGCGRKWRLKLGTRYRLIGIDEDETALRLRAEQIGDLDDYRVGSLVDAEFEPRSFDVIYCSYVLEHAVGVDRILDNFATWIRPGGLIVLRVPDDRSVYGFVAKHTPHWSHVLVKKYVNKAKNAGKPGYDPYPVVYEKAMSQPGILRFCRDRGFSCSIIGDAAFMKKGQRWLRPVTRGVSWLALGQLGWRHDNLTYLIRT